MLNIGKIMCLEDMELKERLERTEEVMKAVSSIDGFEVEEVMSHMIDSFINEIVGVITENEGEEALYEVFSFAKDMVFSARESEDEENGVNPIISLAKSTLASAVAFNTLYKSFISINNDFIELLKDALDTTEDTIEDEAASIEGLCGMLEAGIITLSNIEEHFGIEVASEVLAMASKSMKSNKKDKSIVERELEDFHSLKESIANGELSFEEFESIVNSYSNETKARIKKMADDKLNMLSKEIGLSKETIKDIMSLID